jgi:putative methionine-R-sulfoxide reductase with GAF domain
MTEDAELAALHAIASLASGPDDPAAAASDVLALISSMLESECGVVAFQNPESGKLEIEAGLGLPSDSERSFAPGQGVPGWVAWHAKPLLVPDSSADLRSKPMRRDTRCEMAAPMLTPDGRVQGVIALERDLPGSFGAGDLSHLVRLTDEASRVLHRLWETRHLRGKARP